jgi:3-hydroxybutyryl-CoA dehydrogenase
MPSVVPASSVVVMDSHNEKLVDLVLAAGAKALGLNYPRGPLALATGWL